MKERVGDEKLIMLFRLRPTVGKPKIINMNLAFV